MTEPTLTPPASRNDPCPCGSGQRYKHCHGATVSSSLPAAAASLGELHAANDSARPEESSVALSSLDPELLLKRGMAQHQTGNAQAALALYQHVLTRLPVDAVATHFLGVALSDLGRRPEAWPHLDRSLELMPEEPEFHNNYGVALLADGQIEAALESFELALGLNPGHALAYSNKGLCLRELGQNAAALEPFELALTFNPVLHQARYNLGLAQLTLGDYPEGFKNYETRVQIPGSLADISFPPTPAWDGVAVPGQTLLLLSENGLGDAIQFVRFAATPLALGMKVVLRVPASLVPLFERLSVPIGVRSGLTVVSDAAPAPSFDAWARIPSLPMLVKTTRQSVDSKAYLQADAAAVASWSTRVQAAKGLAKFCVGLVTTGSNLPDDRRALTAEAINALIDHPALQHIHWVSLQKTDSPSAQSALVNKHPKRISDWSGELTDFAQTAALATACDAVVSIDSAVAHLGGALGLPTLVLLTAQPDWRWELGREHSPWYDSARPVRQAARGDWGSVVEQVPQTFAALGLKA